MSVFSRIRTQYGVSLRIQSNMGKHRPEKTPYLDTFHAVLVPTDKNTFTADLELVLFHMRNMIHLSLIFEINEIINCRRQIYFRQHTK